MILLGDTVSRLARSLAENSEAAPLATSNILGTQSGPTGGFGRSVAMGVQQRVEGVIHKSGSLGGLVVGTFAVLLRV